MNILSEKYEVVKELGHGAYSKVFLARHNKLKVLRAVKLIKKSDADYERYLREANLIKNLKHSGIPIIYDIDEDKDSIYIIEEYISGKSLTMFMKKSQSMQYKQICRYGIQICEILEYMHNFNNEGILHLDLKPDNVIIDDNDNVRIIDFDNSVYCSERQAQCVGSKGFAAPEQYHRLKLDKRADIYSLGMLLMYMSDNGHVQSNVDTIRQKNLSKIIEKCTRHNPIQRYNNVINVKRDLQQLLNELSKKNSNTSLIINVTGTKNGIGTTHIALCLSNFLNDNGIKTVCVGNTSSADIRNEAFKGELTACGTYRVNGAYLLPNYNKYIQYMWEDEYEIAVVDNGAIGGETDESTLRWEMNSDCSESLELVVVVGKYYEEQENKIIAKTEKDRICVVNHMSGKQFYSYVKNNLNDRKIYRMPCVYDWQEKNDAEYAMFRELLSENVPEIFYSGNSSLMRKTIRIIKRILKIFKRKQQ